jgi:ribosomal protein L12E/L44/L45/RPP1/RPP2
VVAGGASAVIAGASPDIAGAELVVEAVLEASVDELLEHAEIPKIASPASPAEAIAFR